MSALTDSIQRYLDEIGRQHFVWSGYEARTVAIKIADNWTNLATILRLSTDECAGKEERLFDIRDTLIVLHKSGKTDFNHFKSLIEQLKNGKLEIGGNVILFSGVGSVQTLIQRANWDLEGLHDDEGWPAIIMRGYGPPVTNLMPQSDFDRLIRTLKANEPTPFEDLDELGLRYIGLRTGANLGTYIFVMAPIYCKMTDLLIENGVINVSIKCHREFDSADMLLSVMYYGDIDPRTFRQKLIHNFTARVCDQKAIDSNFVEYHFKMEIGKHSVSLVRLHLFYRGEELLTHEHCLKVDKREEKNLRIVIHEALDKDLAVLSEGINAIDKKRFEPAVTMLLHLVGFNVEHVGAIEEKAGRPLIDFIAITPDSSCIVVGGCVVEGLTPEKVTKIAERAKTVKKTLLESRQHAMAVEPILVTSLTTREIGESVLKRADEDELTILDKDVLVGILANARQGETTDRLLTEFRNKIMERRQARLIQKNLATAFIQSQLGQGF